MSQPSQALESIDEGGAEDGVDFGSLEVEFVNNANKTVDNIPSLSYTNNNTNNMIDNSLLDISTTTYEEKLDISVDISSEDLANVMELYKWLSKNAEIVPSRTKIYCKVLVGAGIGSVSRLAKKLMKDPGYLEVLGINEDDSEEIINMMKIEGLFKTVEATNQLLSTIVMPKDADARPTIIRRDSLSLRESSNLRRESIMLTDSVALTPELDHEQRVIRRRALFLYNEKVDKLIPEINASLQELTAAAESKTESTLVTLLTNITTSLDKNGELRRAYYRADISKVLVKALQLMIHSSSICERILQLVALLSRKDDIKIKANMSLENIKAFGTAGIAEAIVSIMVKYPLDPKVIMASCDAIRSLCALDSNRDKFGVAGVCEALGRSLVTFTKNLEVACWICRAIGHVAGYSDNHKERFGNEMVIETSVLLLQAQAGNLTVCTEVCWVLRNLAELPANRPRIEKEFVPYSIVSVFKQHFIHDSFMVEAIKALIACIADESDDDMIEKIGSTGCIGIVLKALKKNMESDVLSEQILHLFYILSSKEKFIKQMINADILYVISSVLEKHASEEPVALWGCKCVHRIANDKLLLPNMRSAGLCEMVTSAVQRQVGSPSVSGAGCLAIGDLAMIQENHNRLAGAGACGSVILALSRHVDDVEVVFETCFAVHYLSKTPNNIELMRVYEGCEALVKALAAHTPTSIKATQGILRAIGSLVQFKDDGNLLRFNESNACSGIILAFRTYAADHFVAAYACRAIYYLCAENANIAQFAATNGTCGLVVAALQIHSEKAEAVIQACLAIHGLAVKAKTDKVHNGNTRKLVSKSAIECVLAIFVKYADNAEVVRACSLAIASLGRLPENREKLTVGGACDLLIAALHQHSSKDKTVAKVALALDVLAQDDERNMNHLDEHGVCDELFAALMKHDRSIDVIADIMKTLVTLSKHSVMKIKVRNESSLKLYIKCIKTHEKSEYVAKWGCALIYCCASDKKTREKLYQVKACEAIMKVLHIHCSTSAEVSQLACQSICGMSEYNDSKVKFCNNETFTSLCTSIAKHNEESALVEWVSATIINLAYTDHNRQKFGKVGICPALVYSLNKMIANENTIRLASEAIYLLCCNIDNKRFFGICGASEVLADALECHLSNPSTASQIFKAIASLAVGNSDNAVKLGSTGVCELTATCLNTHLYDAKLVSNACAVVAALAEKNSSNQKAFYTAAVSSSICRGILLHRNNEQSSENACKAVKALIYNSTDHIAAFNSLAVVPSILLMLKYQCDNATVTDSIVDAACWILGTIVAPPTATVIPVEITDIMPTITNSKDVYNIDEHWDMLVQLLSNNLSKHVVARSVCSAIAIFAEHGKLANIPACDVVTKTLLKHVEKPLYIQKMLYAFCCLADGHTLNRQRLARKDACKVLDTILAKYGSDEKINSIALRAISCIANDCPIGLKSVESFPDITKNIVTIVWNEIEDAQVSLWGCAAMAALSHNSVENQKKLKVASSYMVDILEAHGKSPEIVLSALHAICSLAHCNITNRNQLGASGVCAEVVKVMQLYNTTSDGDRCITMWAVRAVADLAANNPNNQIKLGYHGACELLVAVLITYKSDIEMLKWTLWAIGNIVQLNKSSIIDRSKLKDNQNNTTKLSNANVADVIVKILRKNINNVIIAEWACRAINNMGRSKTLKGKLHKAGCISVLDTCINIYGKNKHVCEWAKTAKETMETAINEAELAALNDKNNLLNIPGDAFNAAINAVVNTSHLIVDGSASGSKASTPNTSNSTNPNNLKTVAHAVTVVGKKKTTVHDENLYEKI